MVGMSSASELIMSNCKGFSAPLQVTPTLALAGSGPGGMLLGRKLLQLQILLVFQQKPRGMMGFFFNNMGFVPIAACFALFAIPKKSSSCSLVGSLLINGF